MERLFPFTCDGNNASARESFSTFPSQPFCIWHRQDTTEPLSLPPHHGPLPGPHPHATVAPVLSIERPHQGADGSAPYQVHRDARLADCAHYPHLGTAPGEHKGGGQVG